MEQGRDSRGDNLIVYSDGSKHCFACRYHVFPKHYSQPIKELTDANSSVLPRDFSREIPAAAWKWLLQYGLGYKHWLPFVGWSETHSRLVFTLGDPPQFSIGRYIGDEGKRKWRVWGDSHIHPHLFGDYIGAQTIVLVEDLISAHKVSLVTSCIPLFGTTVFPQVVPVLRLINCPITMWLDRDQSHTMTKKCSNLSLLTGLPVRYISTKEDPKCLSIEQIRKELT